MLGKLDNDKQKIRCTLVSHHIKNYLKMDQRPKHQCQTHKTLRGKHRDKYS